MTIKEKVKNWFVKKYDVDEGRMQLIEHKGEDVVHFIEQYVKDIELGEPLQKMLSSLLISKSRLRGRVCYINNHPILQEKDLNKHIENQMISSLIKKFHEETRITIEKSEIKEIGQIEFNSDVFIFNSNELRDTIEAYVTLLPEWRLKQLRGEK